jgi:hypothetical protein
MRRTSHESVTELVSYPLFDSALCDRLIDLGRQDLAAEGVAIDDGRRYGFRPCTSPAS